MKNGNDEIQLVIDESKLKEALNHSLGEDYIVNDLKFEHYRDFSFLIAKGIKRTNSFTSRILLSRSELGGKSKIKLLPTKKIETCISMSCKECTFADGHKCRCKTPTQGNCQTELIEGVSMVQFLKNNIRN